MYHSRARIPCELFSICWGHCHETDSRDCYIDGPPRVPSGSKRIWRKPGVVYRAQAPNARGAQRAVTAGAQEILGLITASETYNLKNQNMTLSRGIESAIATFRIADAAHTPFVMAIGMAMFCAYEGRLTSTRCSISWPASAMEVSRAITTRDHLVWRILAM